MTSGDRFGKCLLRMISRDYPCGVMICMPSNAMERAGLFQLSDVEPCGVLISILTFSDGF